LRQAACRFRHSQGTASYARRVLGHCLRPGGRGLKVARGARRLGSSRATASRQQALAATQALPPAHQRRDGRPSGKRLPRYAGPRAPFLGSHAEATRADLLDFVRDPCAVGVARIALYQFLTKYGLDLVPAPAAPTPVAPLPPGGTGGRPVAAPAEPSAPPLGWGGRRRRGPC
jgi:hypothetical protein